ncbi:Sexual development regulator VELC [Colletotrichum trifolii]|uniref:Sexual development regulator VELC n=1 Tax=Colletotrichum trifolii TaxID=5466 RepID=A0A4R8RR48_COLTR|nr:Sexual development regulator VELC [Colletotrichum trifolii]
MAYTPTEQSPHHRAFDSRAQPDDMAQRHSSSWAPSPTSVASYGQPRPVSDGYYAYDTDPARLPAAPPAALVHSMPSSHAMPHAQIHQPQYEGPEYPYQDYQQSPASRYQQPPAQYQQYAPPPQHSAMMHDPYRTAPTPRYSAQDAPPESPTGPFAPNEPFDPYREVREQHYLLRNQPPAMPGAPRVPNANYDRKVPIPCTPPSLRTSVMRSGSTAPNSGGPLSAASSQADRTVKIESLLTGGGSSQHMSEQESVPPANEYEIFFRQQPVAARCCGYGERDRRVIDPPPIVQLRINNPNLSPDELYDKIHHPAYVVHCSIWDEKGQEDFGNMPADYVRPGKRIMGSLVSSPFVGQDEKGEEGCFFCFPDMSVRTPGLFRLKFSLVVLDLTHQSPIAPIKSSIMSEVFQVFNAKDFPGMQASTPLTKRLKEQGCLISIKKGNEKSGGKGSRRQDESDEEDEGTSTSKRKKAKKMR